MRRPARLAGGLDGRFLLAAAGVMAVAVALRFVSLGGGLPALTAADEPLVMERARGLLAGRTPTDFDWPPASMYFLAGMLRMVDWVWPAALTTAGGPYLFARVMFAIVGVATVGAAIAVGYRLADAGRERSTALVTGLLLAVSFLSVRLSRQVHPDNLQLLAVLLGFLALLRFDAERRTRWLVAAGMLAGLAAATKYVGGIVALPAAVAVLWHPATAARTRLVQLGALGASTVAGIVVGAPLILRQSADVWAGVRFQFGHQADGHLGYDQSTPSWGFHLVHSLPGNWGWPVTVLAFVGLALVARRGSRPQRLGALLALALFVVLGGSKVRFPHYLIPALPFLAAFAVVAVRRVMARVNGRVAAAMAIAVAVSVVPTLLNDVKVIRAATALDTRTVAGRILAELPRPALAERYAAPGSDGSLGDQPQAPECDCVVAISSYMEQRYRREPRRYARQVAVYDALRRRGRVMAVVSPFTPLRYDWDLLPAWGLGRLPVVGDVGSVGPTVTILDLRREGGAAAP